MDAVKGAPGCTESPSQGSGNAGFAAHCPHCRRESIFVETRVAHRKHLLLSIVTAGIWLVPWAAMILGKLLRPYRCHACGWHKPEFRKLVPISAATPPPSVPPAPSVSTPKKMQPPTVE